MARSLLPAEGHVLLGALALAGGDNRPHLGFRIQRITYAHCLGHGGHRIDQLRVHLALDDHPGTGATVLARVGEHRGAGVLGGFLDVHVGKDDVGRLAAQLQRDALDGLGGGGHDPPAGLGLTCESDLGDIRMGR
jgi:hypothetical protein